MGRRFPRCGDGADHLFGGRGADQASGGGGNDVVHGGIGNDRLTGEGGIDFLYGEDGDDYLFGGNEQDFLFGGDGNDALVGGAQEDHMWGGAGADNFVFQPGYGDDFVEDFEAGIDTVQLITFGVGDFASLMAMASDATGDTVIDFGGGDSLTLIGVETGDLSAGDFLL